MSSHGDADDTLSVRVCPFFSLTHLLHVSLFIPNSTGKELTYRDVVWDLDRLLVAVGCSDVADSKGTYGLRIGGATFAAAIGGGYFGG